MRVQVLESDFASVRFLHPQVFIVRFEGEEHKGEKQNPRHRLLLRWRNSTLLI